MLLMVATCVVMLVGELPGLSGLGVHTPIVPPSLPTCYVRVFGTRANAHTRWLCTGQEAHTSGDLLLRSNGPGEWVLGRRALDAVSPLSPADLR